MGFTAGKAMQPTQKGRKRSRDGRARRGHKLCGMQWAAREFAIADHAKGEHVRATSIPLGVGNRQRKLGLEAWEKPCFLGMPSGCVLILGNPKDDSTSRL